MTADGSLDQHKARGEAAATLARMIRERDAADEPLDPDLFAMEFWFAMNGRGWRMTSARSTPWQAAVSGEPAEPNDDWKAARAALDSPLKTPDNPL